MAAQSLTLALAIDKRNWSLAAICLLLGVAEAAAQLPPETFESLVELLAGAPRARRR